jgi:ferredoxin
MISSSSSVSSSSEDEDKDDSKDINNDTNITLETSTSSSSDSDFVESSSSSSSSDSIIISRTIVANNGEILRTAMLRNGISPHNGKSRLINCRGLGTCGTCAIEIYNTGTNDDASDNNKNIEPKERNTKEKLRFNFPPHNLSSNQSPNLRLACQVQVQVNGEDDGSEITVKKRKGFWGQGTMKQKDDDSSIIQQQQQQDGVVVADDDDYKEFDKAELWFGELEYILDNKSPPPSPPSPPSSSRSRSSSTLSSSSSNSYNNPS